MFLYCKPLLCYACECVDQLNSECVTSSVTVEMRTFGHNFAEDTFHATFNIGRSINAS